MPNAEGRMEEELRAALDLFSKSVAFGLLHPYPPEAAAWRTISAALAARSREVEEIRAALTTINALHNLGDAIYDVRERECQGWDGPNVTAYGEAHKVVQAFLNRALAAQEGTR